MQYSVTLKIEAACSFEMSEQTYYLTLYKSFEEQGYINFPKMQAPEGPHEASSILRAHKFVSGATVQNLVAWTTCRPQFVHPCCTLSFEQRAP